MTEEFDTELAMKAALAAAEASAETLMSFFRQDSALDAWMKSPGALVTEADIRSDQAIATAFKSVGAKGAVLSEESSSGESSGDLTWLIDPLCGTVPFRSGMSHWGTNIAFRRGDRLEVAALSMPAEGETFSALAGAGVKLNGQPFVGRDPGLPLDEAVICLEVDGGNEWKRILDARSAGQSDLEWVGSTGQTNIFSSAAYPIGQLCFGRLSAAVFYEIDSVHLAASALVAQELGAIVSDERGEPLDWTSEDAYAVAVVAWPSVHAALINAMADR